MVGQSEKSADYAHIQLPLKPAETGVRGFWLFLSFLSWLFIVKALLLASVIKRLFVFAILFFTMAIQKQIVLGNFKLHHFANHFLNLL